ncbi:MAG: hypothetical protein LBB50_05555 [Oscillospiraceae bacterium]|jgi:cell division septum initiation protein DivIVA|nr:hypothetical protein [Oscillospiraceae bacterium]
MREDYVPNEKYRNMFGVERNGYGMERVDLYLAQLEVAFKKIREDNRNLKRELAEQLQNGRMGLDGLMQQDAQEPAPTQNPALAAQIEQQEKYIAHLQAQLAEQQAQNQRLLAQLSEQGDGQQQNQLHTEGLVTQINALRAEADMLRQQLRRQTAAGIAGTGPISIMSDDIDSKSKEILIGKVLVETRAQAEETLRAAQQEAEQLTRDARRQSEALRAEQDHIYAQLQSVSYTLRNILRGSVQTEYKQRSDEFAAS